MSDRRQQWIDGTFIVGLALTTGGVAIWTIPGALVTAGALLMIAAVLGACLGC